MVIALEILYEEMYKLTEIECAKCRNPYSCCSPEYCLMAEEWANEKWNESCDRYKTDHSSLPFMGDDGCMLPPHFRPLCTLHTCDINGLGYKKNDSVWTEKYYKLREEIENQEIEREKHEC